jgi:hypothetical protein
MFGLDEIYIDLINEAKSPEEIKKILRYQFVDGKGVPENIFEAVLSVDPTKKKNYTRWVLMQWESEGDKIATAVKLGQIKEMFNYFKERSGSGLELGNMSSFTEALSVVPSILEDPIFGIDSEGDEKSNDFNIVYDSSDWRIAVPNTLEAAVKLGRGCKWCTAGAYGNPKYYYDRYSRYGKLWVNFDKRSSEITPMDKREYPYKRYQFCFEAEQGPELMDSSNDRIDIELVNIPSEVFEFYGEQDEDYAYILENAVDSEVAAERRTQRMLENCILRKPGNGNNNDLLLLPSIDEFGNVEESYRMYVSGDLSDPIDRFEYEGNELIDDCHGFPLVFMKNSYNYLREKPINVYFETSRSYNNWNGATRTSYFWECCEDVETFGGNSKIKYFIHPDDKELIISFGPSTSDFERYDLDDFSIDDSDIDEINEVSFRGELPEEYKDGIWLQVTFTDGYSGLWFMDSNKKELVDIIKRDIPYYKDTFELYNNGDNCYIRSRTRKYILSGEDESDVNFNIDKRLEDDENFCTVIYYPNGSSTYKMGLFDLENSELIIKDVDCINDYGKCVLLDYYDYSVFYDYKNRRYLTGKCEHIENYGYTSLVGYTPYGENYYHIFDTELLNDHGPFEKVEKVYSNDVVLVVVNGNKKLYNVEYSTYPLPEDANLVDYEYMPEYLFIYENGGRNYLYSSIGNETIMELSNPIEFTEFNKSSTSFHQTYKVKKANNKYTIISSFGEVLSNFDGDDVIPAYNQLKHNYPNAFVKNGVVYFVFNGRVARPSNGIPLNNFVKYGIIDSNEKWNNISVVISIQSGVYIVNYSPFFNRIDRVITDSNERVTDPLVLKEIEKIFFPEKAQIQEQFRNIIDRMDNL